MTDHPSAQGGPIQLGGRGRLFVLTFVALLLAVVAVIFLARSAPGRNAIVHPGALVGAAALAVIQLALTPVFSLLALLSLGRPAKYGPLLLITLVSASVKASAPLPAGIPVRAMLQKKICGIPYTVSAGAMLIETVVGYGCIVLAGLLAGWTWLRPVLLERFSFNPTPARLTVTVAIALVVCLAIVLISRHVRGRFGDRLREVLMLLRGTRPGPLAAMIGIIAVTFLLYLWNFSLILHALGAGVSPGPLFAAVTLSYLAGAISFIPMGLGVKDVSLVGLLVILGVSAAQSAAAAFLDRLIMTVPLLMGGVFAVHHLGRRVLERIPGEP